MNSYFNITVTAEWITFIAALLLLNKKTGAWQLFSVLLFLVLCTETIGWYMHMKLRVFDNALPFNILMLISILFFIWFFSRAAALQKVKRELFIMAGLFTVFALVNLFFFQGLWQYNSHSESLGDVILVLISCYFLFSIVKAEAYINLARYEYFWFTVGVLFHALGSALLYQFSTLLWNYYLQTNIRIGTYINYALNLILDGSLIIAFICKRKSTQSL